ARCMIGGQAGFEGHISIADETKVGAQTGVLRSTVTPGEKLMGSPALGLTEYYKAYSVFRKLPDLKKQIEQLEEKILNSR
ncbi:MAG: UDP-3-O-(3-hydroxymyristoyl)glucosamine N-acyltransferase, partial [Cyclobacteriaceae bacterium]|nr:UDP-3-O-(3-hydroxymyristoyl)glucosamine N-acyltransferase [Cyclobacteriaceae bacterium]